MSDPTDLSWWFGNQGSTNLDPNAAKLQGADQMRGYAQGQLGLLGGRQAPQANNTILGGAAQLNQGNYDQWRQQQMGLAGQLGAVASGQQAGAGELSVNRQVQNALAAQQSVANSARGANAMLGARAAARGAADLGVNGAGMASQAALQDQTNARGLLAGVLGQGAQQDIGIANANAGFNQQRTMQQGAMNQQTSLSNMQAQLQMMGMNDQAALGYLSQMTGMSQAELAARMQQEQMSIAQQQPGFAGGLLQAGAGVAAAALTGGGKS